MFKHYIHIVHVRNAYNNTNIPVDPLLYSIIEKLFCFYNKAFFFQMKIK